MITPSDFKPLTVDDLIDFFGDMGSSQDRQKAYLSSKGYASNDLSQAWMDYLTSLGYTSGSLNDRHKRWFKDTLLVLAAKRNKGFGLIPQDVEMTRG